ncbi:MAG: hypothetical protein ABIV47_03560 [Roseiflexaceae bacterium]
MHRQQTDTTSSFQKQLASEITVAESYYVELSLEALDDQGSLLDSLIQFTFDTPHLRHLDLRIIAAAH